MPYFKKYIFIFLFKKNGRKFLAPRFNLKRQYRFATTVKSQRISFTLLLTMYL